MEYHRQNSTFQFEEDAFAKNVQNIGKFMLEVIIFLKFSLNKPQIKITIYIIFIRVKLSKEIRFRRMGKYEIRDKLFQALYPI